MAERNEKKKEKKKFSTEPGWATAQVSLRLGAEADAGRAWAQAGVQGAGRRRAWLACGRARKACWRWAWQQDGRWAGRVGRWARRAGTQAIGVAAGAGAREHGAGVRGRARGARMGAGLLTGAGRAASEERSRQGTDARGRAAGAGARGRRARGRQARGARGARRGRGGSAAWACLCAQAGRAGWSAGPSWCTMPLAQF